MKHLSQSVNTSINISDKYTISVHDVMKKGKPCGHEGLCSDNIINAPHSLFVMLTLIYNTMLVHGLRLKCWATGQTCNNASTKLLAKFVSNN